MYTDFSLQEITCITSTLSVWFGEQIDYLATKDQEYHSEEGLRVLPTKTMDDVRITDYDCVILPGTINPMPALYDRELLRFLQSGVGTSVVFAAISSAPILLAKAGLLQGRKFTAGFFMQMADVYPFVEKENMLHQGVVSDGNVITGIGMFFREFAETVLRHFDYDIGEGYLQETSNQFTEEDLTFIWSDEDFQEFLKELKQYQ